MAPWPDILDTRDPDVAFRHVAACYIGIDNFDVVGKALATSGSTGRSWSSAGS